MSVTVTFVGSGDAFGAGGRFQTCILVDAPGFRFVIDFGASSLIALEKLGIAHNSIDGIVLTHIHGDHCGGIPFLLTDAMLGAKRTTPLIIAGPRDTEARLTEVCEALMPGMHVMTPKFDLTYQEIDVLRPTAVGPLTVTSYPAAHTGETNPTSVRVDVAGKTVAYTGDSAWTKHMPALADGADLLVAECYFYEKPIRFHLNYPDLKEHWDELKAKRIVLTHFSREMMAHKDDVSEECAYDGKVVEL
ncbi:MAG: MBL fold metallo-hydrolase [Rhodospirillaceae bacterium]